jgi:hypothetical protein
MVALSTISVGLPRTRHKETDVRAAAENSAAVEETLAYYTFPQEHWRRIRTNNPLERILREIRRRTRVVGAFPDGQSALNLAAAMLTLIDTALLFKIQSGRLLPIPPRQKPNQ